MANDPNFQITPCSALTECNELKFHVYLFQILSGPDQNEVFSVTISEKFGSIVACNWEVRDGPSIDAKIVARAQGLHAQGGQWCSTFSLVFENERFKGSTLQVMGTPDTVTGEWAIVGGTGDFRMTTGVINKRWLELRGSTRIIELTIHGFCPVLKVQTVREPGSSIQSLVTKAGLCGGNEGTELDVKELPSRLESVTIRSSSAIDSIEFSYVDQSGRRCTEGPWGGAGGTAHPMDLGSNEFVKEISGTFDRFDDIIYITSFKLVTNERTFGPWALPKGTPFSISAPAGSAIVGFYARGGPFLNAIGVYLKSL